MTKARIAALGAALVALGAAAPAHAAWHVTTLTSSETFLRGVDARPDRVPVILDERVSGGVSRLELRVGRKAPQTIATSRHAFNDVRVDHDDRGAARRRMGRAAGRRATAASCSSWSAAAGAPQQLTTRHAEHEPAEPRRRR